jgi:drug/metabolite transporter (DMT)-like permease
VTTHSGLKYLDPRSGARISVPSATLALWLLAPWLDLSGWNAIAVGLFALVGLFFPASVTLLTFEANRRLGPNVSGAIGSTTPLFAVIGAALWLSEPLAGGALAGTAMIVLGTVALARPREGVGENRGRGAMGLAWAAAALRALAHVLSKAGLALWPSPFAAALLGYTISSAVVWATPRGREHRPYTRRGIAWFVASGLLNGIAVLALYSALERGPVVLVSPIAATYPLFTLALSALWLREERLSAALVGGMALTVTGVIVLLLTR